MAAEQEPGVRELFEAISRCEAIAFEGIAMRSVAPMYANPEDYASGIGAARTGGRWTKQGLTAIYFSLSPKTAAVESYKEFESLGFAGVIRPRVFVGARIRLSRVLDLNSQAIRKRLGFTLAELLNEDWISIQNDGDESWTQAVDGD